MDQSREGKLEIKDEDQSQYDVGFQAGLDDKWYDNTKSWPWCRGWLAAKNKS